MPGQLNHSPAEVLQKVLVALELCSEPPTDNYSPGSWPVFVSNEPDRPTECVTLFDTTGIFNGRTMVDGEKQGHYGIQIRLRSETYAAGFQKIYRICTTLDEMYYIVVTIEGSQYRVQCANRTNDPVSLGKQVPANRNDLFTVDLLLMLRML